MDKLLAYMEYRRELIDQAIQYVQGLGLFLDVKPDEVPEYAQELIDEDHSVESMRMVIDMHAEWVRMGSK